MKLGLRAQILLSLLVVTVGAIVSVGAIAVWQTRQAIAAERLERVARIAAALPHILTADPARLDVARGALDAEEIAVLDEAGRVVLPAGAAPLDIDARGAAGALAGVPPHPEDRPGSRLRLVAYAPVGTARVARVTFAFDTPVEATLDRARNAVLLLAAADGLILLLVAALLLRSSVLKPIQALEQAARRVAAGDLEAKVETRGPGEIGQLADAFEGMTRSLRSGRESLIRSETLAGVGRLAAGVAHEVGNPLAAILGYAEMLLDETPDRPIEPALRRDILARVRAETVRIHHIIKELLEYARPPRDEVESVVAAKVVEGAVSLVKAQARLREVTVDVALPGDLPPLRATSGRLTQVLLNLLLNAADAMGGKGKIVVDGRREDGMVVLGVADEGPGVPDDARGKIFDLFYTTKEPGDGSGLGLSVSQAIVEGYGGWLRLVDAERGARFEVALPAVVTPPSRAG
ncbi:MAG TPA: ATP-binding protein [Haliangiales bacterium]|nr:ATP-binding protein [Haliangiales bacterium]